MDNLYIKKVLNGEPEEFRYFINQYKDMAFSIAFSVVKNEFVAAEIVQEAYVKAYQNLKTFKGYSKFSTWFYRIVINESYKALRKKGEKYVDLNYEKGINTTVNPGILEDFKVEEQKFFINESLNRLPANECLVLRLYYLNENSIKEICEMTGWSESNVKVLMYRGRNNMQQILQKMLKQEAKFLI